PLCSTISLHDALPIYYIPLLRLQSIYFLAMGVWPLISLSTFLKVTGSKNDLWLVKTVGVLILVIGLALLITSFNKKRNSQIIFLDRKSTRLNSSHVKK